MNGMNNNLLNLVLCDTAHNYGENIIETGAFKTILLVVCETLFMLNFQLHNTEKLFEGTETKLVSTSYMYSKTSFYIAHV